MPRKPFPCAVCGKPLHPGSNTLPEGVAAHVRCGGGLNAPRTVPLVEVEVRPPDAVASAGETSLESTSVDEGAPAMESRKRDLEWMREITRSSIREAPAEKRAPLIAQLRGITEELDKLMPKAEPQEVAGNGLIDLQAAIRARRNAASAASDRPAG